MRECVRECVWVQTHTHAVQNFGMWCMYHICAHTLVSKYTHTHSFVFDAKLTRHDSERTYSCGWFYVNRTGQYVAAQRHTCTYIQVTQTLFGTMLMRHDKSQRTRLRHIWTIWQFVAFPSAMGCDVLIESHARYKKCILKTQQPRCVSIDAVHLGDIETLDFHTLRRCCPVPCT